MKKEKKTPAYIDIVREYYGNEVVYFDDFGQSLVNRMRALGYDPEKVMLANSICSDDVNAMQLPPSIAKFLGPFNLGGLDGFPFTGKTGMGAFSHHAPDNGILLVFFAPHIGISRIGFPKESVGKIKRKGQAKLSDACGAIRAALNVILNPDVKPDATGFIPRPGGELDHQQDTIISILWGERERIRNSKKDPMIEATQIMYEHISRRITELLPKDRKHAEIIVVGGIFINVDTGEKPFFCFGKKQRFDIIKTSNQKSKNCADGLVKELKKIKI